MVVLKLKLFILPAAFVALIAAGAAAQTNADKQDPAALGRQDQKPRPLGSPEEEMLRRAEIRHEEEEHKEMVERADQAALLGEEILSSYRKNNSLTRDDLKKLERMEKLVRKIRGGAGGSDDEKLANPPGKLGSVVSRIAELSGALKNSVLKTSRLVISAAVIERSNELLELIRHIRSLQKP
jgi:hypothetical protein